MIQSSIDDRDSPNIHGRLFQTNLTYTSLPFNICFQLYLVQIYTELYFIDVVKTNVLKYFLPLFSLHYHQKKVHKNKIQPIDIDCNEKLCGCCTV
jgi:hypothetical protein